MEKDLVENVLIRLLGVMFGLGVSAIGLILSLFGIVLCTSVIGLLVGVPMIVYGIGLIFNGIAVSFEFAIKGKCEFKLLNNFKKDLNVEAEKFDFGNVKFVSLSPVVEKYDLN